MIFIYRFLINVVLLLSPIIVIIRLLKKKEDFFRFKEKIGFFSNKRKKGKLIWFHGASVGELQSVVPILEKFEKNKKISQILVTSNTLSSSKIIKNTKLKNAFGGEFKILQVSNSEKISRTKNKLVCLGDVKLDSGMESKLRMVVTEEDGQIWYKYSVE